MLIYKDIIFESPEVIEQVRQWRNRDDIRCWMYNNHVITEEEHSDWIKSLRAERSDLSKKFRREVYVIYDDDIPVGSVNLQSIDWHHRRAEWGIYIGQRGKEKNVGKKAAHFIMGYAFDVLHLEKLNCTVFGNNERALHYHEGCGMKPQGILKNEIQFDPTTRVDLHCLGMTKEDWKGEAKNVI